MAVELDDFDLNILGLLLRDGRTPASQLADRVGLSRPAVAERIEKLERNGVIRGTTVVVEPAALGREITAFVSARGDVRLTPKAWKGFEELMRSDEVLEVHTVAGDDCFLIKVRTASIASLNTLVARLTAPPLSLSTRTTIVMQTHCEKIGGITLGDPS
ncbi:MAG: Lrp/AsnC family transcriptional regulator, leucine-responsive regulatory protein [Acidobacteriota bacterium]|jgi:Lrp/AsnC family leucine-responsive transcriptional regulator|nr:Lrp/AsnC family transcriptional regulator, leucine-responsive regulatory protein [Acidobacteriota bacterium]